MDRSIIVDKIIMIVADYTGITPDKIVEGSNLFTELGLDSLEFLCMIAEIERKCHVQCKRKTYAKKELSQQITSLSTVGLLCDYAFSRQKASPVQAMVSQ